MTEREVSYVRTRRPTAGHGNASGYASGFEAAFAAYVGVRHCCGGAALHGCPAPVARSAWRRPRRRAIVPELTWIATASPITYVGATPVFADVDRETWCITADSIRACITPQTKAIIPVDLTA